MAEAKPSSLHAMSQVSGVGAAKLERYGEAFVEVIRSFSPPRHGEGDQPQAGGGLPETLSKPPPPHFVRSPSPSRGG